MPVVSVNSRNADGSPVLKEGEQVLATQPNVSLYFLPHTSEGTGVVYVTTMNVIWLSTQNTSKGYSIDFPYISLHAVSRDTTHFPHHCLYCQLDAEVPENDDDDSDDDEMGDGGGTGGGGGGGGGSAPPTSNGHSNGTTTYTEARFVAADPTVLDSLFSAFSQGASLNPDEEKEDEGDFFYNEEEVNRNLAALENAEINLPEGENHNGDGDQFADAENEGADDEEMSG